MEDNSEYKGLFIESLKRNNKAIRDDRAAAIHEDAEMIYKRFIEDLETKRKRLIREMDYHLDLSPTDKTSLIPALNFKADEFVKRDHQLNCELRNVTIELRLAQIRYKRLFTAEPAEIAPAELTA